MCPGRGSSTARRVEAGSVVPHPDLHTVADRRDLDGDAAGGRVLPCVGHRLLRHAVEGGAQIRGRLPGQPVDDLDRPAGLAGRVIEVLAEGHHQPLAVQRAGPQLEEQRPEALDRASHGLVELHQLARLHHLARPGEGLEPEVDRAHHLDRIVVDVGGDPPPLFFLGVLQSLRELPPLLDRPPEHIQAPSELVFGVLLGADVEHDALPVRGLALVVEHGHGLVADPHEVPVLREHPVLREEPIPHLVRSPVLIDHGADVVGMDLLEPELGGRPPFLRRVPEELHRLRAHVEVRGELVGTIEVDDRRDALDHRAVGLEVLRTTRGRRAAAHRRAMIPASNAMRGTTLRRSIHSAGA